MINKWQFPPKDWGSLCVFGDEFAKKENEGRDRTLEQNSHRISSAFSETGRGNFWTWFKLIQVNQRLKLGPVQTNGYDGSTVTSLLVYMKTLKKSFSRR